MKEEQHLCGTILLSALTALTFTLLNAEKASSDVSQAEAAYQQKAAQHEGQVQEFLKSTKVALVPGQGAYILFPGENDPRWMTAGDKYKNFSIDFIGNVKLDVVVDGRPYDLYNTYLLPGNWKRDYEQYIIERIDDQRPYVDSESDFVITADGGVTKVITENTAYQMARQGAPYIQLPEKASTADVHVVVGPRKHTKVNVLRLRFK
jgi:hypothetical protein